MTKTQRWVVVALGAIALLTPTRAFAYLDPAAGSILLQVLLGGIAGCAVFAKLFWSRLRGLFGAKKRPERNDDNSSI